MSDYESANEDLSGDPEIPDLHDEEEDGKRDEDEDDEETLKDKNKEFDDDEEKEEQPLELQLDDEEEEKEKEKEKEKRHSPEKRIITGPARRSGWYPLTPYESAHIKEALAKIISANHTVPEAVLDYFRAKIRGTGYDAGRFDALDLADSWLELALRGNLVINIAIYRPFGDYEEEWYPHELPPPRIFKWNPDIRN